jgi:uncharacterized membrane protein
MTLVRSLRHLFAQRWLTRRRFNADVLADIEKAIGDFESRHSGELRFVVETSLEPGELWRGLSPRERAAEVFARLGVWDTGENNGVLIYVLLADRDVEILADRGIAARVTQHEWEQVCRDIEGHYRAGRFGQGSVAGIRDVGALLARHFPGARVGRSELPDQPILL